MSFLKSLWNGKSGSSVFGCGDYTFCIETGNTGQDGKAMRETYRVDVPGMRACVSLFGSRLFPVKDLSVGGLGLWHGGGPFEVGSYVTVDLIENDAIVVEGLRARIARIEGDICGMAFEALDRRREKDVSRIVLREQKKMLEWRRRIRFPVDEAM